MGNTGWRQHKNFYWYIALLVGLIIAVGLALAVYAHFYAIWLLEFTKPWRIVSLILVTLLDICIFYRLLK